MALLLLAAPAVALANGGAPASCGGLTDAEQEAAVEELRASGHTDQAADAAAEAEEDALRAAVCAEAEAAAAKAAAEAAAEKAAAEEAAAEKAAAAEEEDAQDESDEGARQAATEQADGASAAEDGGKASADADDAGDGAADDGQAAVTSTRTASGDASGARAGGRKAAVSVAAAATEPPSPEATEQPSPDATEPAGGTVVAPVANTVVSGRGRLSVEVAGSVERLVVQVVEPGREPWAPARWSVETDPTGGRAAADIDLEAPETGPRPANGPVRVTIWSGDTSGPPLAAWIPVTVDLDPPMPTGLAARVRRSGDVVLSWDAPASPVDRHRVRRADGSGPFLGLPTTDWTATGTRDPGVEPGSYRYELTASRPGADGQANRSEAVVITVEVPEPDRTRPQPDPPREREPVREPGPDRPRDDGRRGRDGERNRGDGDRGERGSPSRPDRNRNDGGTTRPTSPGVIRPPWMLRSSDEANLQPLSPPPAPAGFDTPAIDAPQVAGPGGQSSELTLQPYDAPPAPEAAPPEIPPAIEAPEAAGPAEEPVDDATEAEVAADSAIATAGSGNGPSPDPASIAAVVLVLLLGGHGWRLAKH